MNNEVGRLDIMVVMCFNSFTREKKYVQILSKYQSPENLNIVWITDYERYIFLVNILILKIFPNIS